ncbi:hypothetical protein BOTBODRAFT_633172 [Botryobasidium botryosum FD-172 SS1]|uniref:SEC7 domain-containing protein n=1 Tax=Botryobasidium botryosum (strain FD-172 SS1) TaxID=930990 RepID=A0A067MEU2_BOTB1|nr:hypothetical protein BOTBODRAFT_633172 [Botryobasidium botryosum FD-172 SS1]
MASNDVFELSVSPSHLVFSEIIAVTSAMRKNSRWGAARVPSGRSISLASNTGIRAGRTPETSQAGEENVEVDLMDGFESLKRDIRGAADIKQLPLPILLAPFVALIRSQLSTGPITQVALSSIHAFFAYGLIHPDSPSSKLALRDLSNAVAHCKFEGSDSSSNEVVLLKLLSVSQDCICSANGTHLDDESVCDLVETILGISCRLRLSETVRRSAESALQTITRHVFTRLKSLDAAAAEAETATSNEEQPSAERDIKPYGLSTAKELLIVLINILDIADQQYTDSMRLIALGVLNVALEVAGTHIATFPSLSAILLDKGCKYLFQLAHSSNSTIICASLRAILALFDTMGPQLKLQGELFLSFTLDRLTPPPPPPTPKPHMSLHSKKSFSSITSTPQTGSPRTSAMPDNAFDSFMLDKLDSGEVSAPSTRPGVQPAKGETRELLLEVLGQLARRPSFMVDLWVNYDCDIKCEDVFERMIGFLTRGVYPSQYSGGLESQQYTSQFLCLEVLLAFIDHMTTRSESEEVEPNPLLPKPEDLAYSKSRKGTLLAGAARFNQKPKTGIEFLEEKGMIYTGEESRERSLATFLKNTPRLDKKLLGDYISRSENGAVLTEFMKLFDFRDKSIAEAMRELLESFRLPGESQQIARITETFAEIYFASQPAEIKSQDAVYVLSYAVIMLNTDLHNPQVRKRMTPDDFKRNLRGVNDGTDFSAEYLDGIYESIRKREIVMPEEHTGQVGFDYAWKELLHRSHTVGPLIPCNTPAFDVSMFKLVWKPVISAIAFAFTSFDDDDYIMQRAIAGLNQCAGLAGKFQLPEVFDFIVSSLSHATGLLGDVDVPMSANFPVAEKEGQSVTVSPLSVRFGTNIRGQLAAVVLFNIANGNGNAIRQGWSQIFEMFETLFLHSLLPLQMLQMEEFLGGNSAIPLQGNLPPAPPPPRSDGGLLSALSSYLMTPYATTAETVVPQPTNEDIDNTLCTIDCIGSFRLDELYGQIMSLDLQALIAAIRALAALANNRTIDRLYSQDNNADTDDEPSPSAHYDANQLPYDPTSVFLLEVMVSITIHTKEYIEDTWPIVFEHISSLLSLAARFSDLLIERAVVGLLKLCMILAEKESLRDQLYVALDQLGGLPHDVMGAVAEQLISGVAALIQRHRGFIRSQTEWGLIFGLIRGLVSHHEAGKVAFQVIVDLVGDGNTVTADNYLGLIAILDEFANVASYTIGGKRQEERRGAAQASNGPLEPPIERGVKAIEVLYNLRRDAPRLIENSRLEPTEAWAAIWLPLLGAFARQSSNTCRPVRHDAAGYLQRILLSPQLVPSSTAAPAASEADEHERVVLLFDRVIFPLLEELLKPQVFVRDPQGMPETRLRASTLLCKTFLHFEGKPGQTHDITKLWLAILDYLDRLMNSGRRDQVFEAVPESLKNVVLVMNACDILVPPWQGGEQEQPESTKALWTATHNRMERFLPGFMEHVLPAPPAPPPPVVITPPHPTPSTPAATDSK